MNGFIQIPLPYSCQQCYFFDTIMKEPLTINVIGRDPEVVNGACKCNVDVVGRRLVPMDNGDIMQIEAEPIYNMETRTVQFNTSIFQGRPNWCPIFTERWQ